MADTTPRTKPGRYDHGAIERKWQSHWAEQRTFRTPNPGEDGFDASRPKYYVLDMFPYPSGAGLHVGHPVGYCATDIVTRYKRMRGYNVLHPMGFDAFGLPAEQYAIETNVHPAITTKKNIERYREQLRMFGFSYDWDREVATCDASYYRFTQWIFLQLFHSWYDPEMEWTGPDGSAVKGRTRPMAELEALLASGEWSVSPSLTVVRGSRREAGRDWSELNEAEKRRVLDSERIAYVDEIAVNWCPKLGTVLANEEVDAEGRSDRGGHRVYRKPLRQWMLRITRFADRLLSDLEPLDWPEPIKLMQRNWIGRSTGAEVVFPRADKWSIEGGAWRYSGDAAINGPLSYENFPDSIRIYTTRPDTLFGATYMVLAPEHPLVQNVTTAEQKDAVEAYVAEARHRSELDRTADTKDKTGVFTGGYAINPVTGENVPIWIADYVLMGYGTGAIMAVPAGDTRDYEFATKFGLPIVCVNTPTESWIEERVSALAESAEATARKSFAEVTADFPELEEDIARVREKSKNLAKQMVKVFRDGSKTAALVEHYVKHPTSWGEAFIGEGVAVNSPAPNSEANVPGGACELNGLPTPDAKKAIVKWLEASGAGRGAVNYKLRDWIFSRQKYWGEPFPVLHSEEGATVAVDESELPVELPPMENFKPAELPDDPDTMPEPPLGRAKEWASVDRGGETWRRDLNTMPQWAGSCWYYLRFIDPKNEERFVGAGAEKYWMPIDLYIGGAEHAVLHLLYARFWHKVLFDLGHVSTAEPFGKLFNQGMIQGFAFKDPRGRTLGVDQVKAKGDGGDDDEFTSAETGEPVQRVIAKMSKSLKNVVNPDEIVEEYGADTFRLYEMFMGPLESSKPWNTRDVPGLYKLCQRVWRLVVDERTDELSPQLVDDAAGDNAKRMLHKTIKRVTEDLEALKLNTAIAAIFDFVNFATPLEKRPREVIEPFVLLLAPFAPHLCEELWQRLGHEESLAYAPWPAFDPALAKDDEVEIAVQICGKVKSRVLVAADADEKTLEAAAMADDSVAKAIQGKTVRKVIVVKGRLVNIVAT